MSKIGNKKICGNKDFDDRIHKHSFSAKPKIKNKLMNDIKKAKQGDLIKTHCRNMIVLPSFVGHNILIHNGKDFERVNIQPQMIGHYLGEFALTRKKVKHTGPGVGATRGSKFMPLK